MVTGYGHGRGVHGWANVSGTTLLQSGVPAGQGEGHRVMIKLLMTWDLKNDLEQPYLEFVMREFVPGLMRLGVQPTEAWYTLYGDGPQILSGGVTDNLESMEEVLASDEWQELVSKLLGLVTNFQYKIIRANGRFQL